MKAYSKLTWKSWKYMFVKVIMLGHRIINLEFNEIWKEDVWNRECKMQSGVVTEELSSSTEIPPRAINHFSFHVQTVYGLSCLAPVLLFK